MYDNIRSIPSACDGLKPAQRKILFACFKRNLRAEIKVAQLSGYVAEHTGYHHGEESLSQAIIGMAQNFVGSNNINLLQPIGQFGTRHMGGKEAASPRYLYTALSKIARYVFREEDDALLKYQIDEGQKAEPEWYLPILPMILVNGSEGIGSGWRSSIPNYDPRQIVECIRSKMRGEKAARLMPRFKGYEGQIVDSEESFLCYGKCRVVEENTIEISELPIRRWTRDYKNFLEEMMEGYDKVAAKKEATKAKLKGKGKAGRKRDTKDKKKKEEKKKTLGKRVKRKRGGEAGSEDEEEDAKDEDWGASEKKTSARAAKKEPAEKSATEVKIEDIKEYHKGNVIRFVIRVKAESMAVIQKTLAEPDGETKLLKLFKLASSVPKSQFVCFDTKGQLKRYTDAEEIIDEYYQARLALYARRKEHQLRELRRELLLLENKARFINAVISGQLSIYRQKKPALVARLAAEKYVRHSDLKAQETAQDKLVARLGEDESAEPEAAVALSEYDYLLGMPLYALTEEKVEDLLTQKRTKEEQVAALEKMAELQMWEKDLDEFLAVLDSLEQAEQDQLMKGSSVAEPMADDAAGSAKKGRSRRAPATGRRKRTPPPGKRREEALMEDVEAAPEEQKQFGNVGPVPEKEVQAQSETGGMMMLDLPEDISSGGNTPRPEDNMSSKNKTEESAGKSEASASGDKRVKLAETLPAEEAKPVDMTKVAKAIAGRQRKLIISDSEDEEDREGETKK